MASPEDNEAAIRVQLSLMNAQDSAAAKDLANSLKEIAKMFEALKASDFRESATKMAQLHQQMVMDTQQVQNQQMQQRGGAIRGAINRVLGGSNPPSNASLAAAGADDPTRAAAQANADAASDAEKERREVERWRLDSLDDQQRAAEHQRSRLGLPGIGAGADSPRGADDPSGWYNRVDTLSGETSGFRIPRFGELNIQDLISRAQGGLNRTAVGQGDFLGMSQEAAQRWAPRAQTAQNVVGNLYAAREFGGRINNWLGGQGFSAAGMDASGAALGFRRDSNAFSDILGFQTPFSAAGAQGWRQSMDIQRLRFSAGINKEQAASIVGATAGAGFSGERGSDIARNFMAPLFRQFQLDPSQLAAHLQVIRTGTATLDDLSKELADIGENARNAQVDVNTMNQALVGAGEASQALGGNYLSGVRFGRTFTQSTGLLPGVGQNILQNSTTQAMLAGATGLPTFALGAASTSAKMASIQQSSRLYYNAYKNALGTQGRRSPIKDAQGNIVGYDEGSNPAMAAAAAKFGVSGDEFSKLMSGQDQASRLSALNTALDAYGTRAGHLGNVSDAAAANRWIQSMGPNIRVNPHTGRVERNKQSRTSFGPVWEADDDLTKEFNRRSSTSVMGQLRRSASGEIDQGDIVHFAHQAGLRGHALGAALKGKTPDEQIRAVRRLADSKSADERAKYEIAFTGPAAKFFKAVAKRNGLEDQYNDMPKNVASASAQGPSPLSDLTNSSQALNSTPMP